MKAIAATHYATNIVVINSCPGLTFYIFCFYTVKSVPRIIPVPQLSIIAFCGQSGIESSFKEFHSKNNPLKTIFVNFPFFECDRYADNLILAVAIFYRPIRGNIEREFVNTVYVFLEWRNLSACCSDIKK